MSRYLVKLFGFSFFMLFVLSGISFLEARENPFRSSTLCLPLMSADAIPMEFDVSEANRCLPSERLMKVYRHEKEGILLLPAPPAKSAEDEREEKTLDNFKKFYGK